MARDLRLGINIDHVATVRNARGGRHPDPVRAARLALAAGADGVTAHLREDRRHIDDDDVARVMAEVRAPFNLEMAATEEMVAAALRYAPHAVCLVPERREERTTEGGLDARAAYEQLQPAVDALTRAGIKVSLFLEPTFDQLDAARALGAAAVELHTGTYCGAEAEARRRELGRIAAAAAACAEMGMECHAGHGLDYDNVAAIAAIPFIEELNIGHFLVGEAIFLGLEASVRRMRAVIDQARTGAGLRAGQG